MEDETDLTRNSSVVGVMRVMELTSTEGTMNPEESARNSCNSWPLYAR